MAIIKKLRAVLVRIRASFLFRKLSAGIDSARNHVARTKLQFFSFLCVCWLFLVGGIFFAKDRQIIPEMQLATTQVFQNGAGSITITEQIYSEENQSLLLMMESLDGQVSSTDLGIPLDQLEWHFFAKKAEGATLTIVPTIDNKFAVLIEHVAPDFEALSIYVTTHSITTNGIDTTVEDMKEAEEATKTSSTSEETVLSDTVQFYLVENHPELKRDTFEIKSPKAFALEAIKRETEFQQSQVDKLTKAITQLEKVIVSNGEKQEQLEAKAYYLTGKDKVVNDEAISSLEADTRSQENEIARTENSIVAIQAKIDMLDKKAADISSGVLPVDDVAKTTIKVGE